MKRTEATVYVVGWLSVASIVIFGVKSCADNHAAISINDAKLRNEQWMAQREDCNNHGGMMIVGWGGWKCEGLK